MRLSLFRSRSNTPSQSPSSTKKSHRISLMLSPSRTNSEPIEPAKSVNNSSITSPSPAPSAPQIPLDFAPHLSGVNQDFNSTSSPTQLPSEAQDGNRPRPPIAQRRVMSDHGDLDLSAIDEAAMTRKLMDVESSFIPDPSNSTGGSNVLLNPNASRDASSNVDSDLQTRNLVTEPSLESAVVEHLDPVSANDSLLKDPSQNGLSSPAAAAAQRSEVRAASRLKVKSLKSDFVDPSGQSLAPQVVSGGAEEEDSIPKQIQNPQLPSNPTRGTFYISSRRSLERTSQLHSHKSRRPRYLSNRQSSQRASKDSLGSQRSEGTTALEQDGPSGGATPHTLARTSRELSRLPSFGSMASSVSDGVEPLPIKHHDFNAGSAQGLTNQVSSEVAVGSSEALDQTTPRASNTRNLGAPSDTVLAQHVRDVEVPDTVAKEYRAAYSLDTPSKPSTHPTPFFNRGKRELTLKEQNSKLDKLTKENFDLKLKIHFLHQALQERSDEGVSDLTSQNAHLQADVVKLKRENQNLRKQLGELQGKQKGWENASASHQQSAEGSEDDSSRSYIRSQYEDEIFHLRNQVLALQDKNASLLKGSHPEWNTLEREIARREHAERRASELQHQVEKLRAGTDRSAHLRIRASNSSLNHGQRPVIGDTISEEHEVDSLSGSTLVDHLRQENATLKRDLGVQTDMLSSRNRERERLQQEIEDLKLDQRRNDRNGSTAGESIFDRSASRSQNRPISRVSNPIRDPQLNDDDRDRLENVQDSLRDEVAELKMRNQDLQMELNTLGDGAEHIRTLQAERDEAVQALREADADIDYLYSEMDQVEELVLQKEQEIDELDMALQLREEEAEHFRRELKEITEGFDMLGEDREASQATIQGLQQDVASANGELEAMEKNLQDLAATKERLEVQQESAENEIVFLREEQEADKIKIGDLQSALDSAKSSLKNEESKFNTFEALEEQASKAREEARELRKTLSGKETEISAYRDKHAELQETLDTAAKHFEETKKELLENIRNMTRDAESKSRELEQGKLDYDQKDRVLRDRETLLESSNNETRRLGDLLDKERQGRKHDRNEYERALRAAKGTPEARVLQLETANTKQKQGLADLQTRYDDQVRSRDTLLLSLWTRLSEFCKDEKLMESEQAPHTIESISKDLSAFDEQLTKIIEAIKKYVGAFPTKLNDTEKAIRKDFQHLQDSLQARIGQLSKLEEDMDELMQTRTERRTDNMSSNEYLSRLKEENKLLKRELRYLKEGSFALPGLVSPFEEQYHETTETNKNKGEQRDDSALAPIVPSTRSRPPLTTRKGSLLHRTRSANETDPPGQSSLRETSSETVNPKNPAAGVEAQRSLSTVTAIRHEPSLGTGDNESEQPQNGAAAAGVNVNDQKWVLRLEELKKRLRMEREGRLLDRDGARKRLEQGRRENTALKAELRREKVRSTAPNIVNSSAANPPGANIVPGSTFSTST